MRIIQTCTQTNYRKIELRGEGYPQISSWQRDIQLPPRKIQAGHAGKSGKTLLSLETQAAIRKKTKDVCYYTLLAILLPCCALLSCGSCCSALLPYSAALTLLPSFALPCRPTFLHCYPASLRCPAAWPCCSSPLVAPALSALHHA